MLCLLGLLWLSGKEPACQAGDLGSIPGLGRFPWRRKWQPTPLFLSRKSHGQRSLVRCSPWGCKESDTTWQLNNHHLPFYLRYFCCGFRSKSLEAVSQIQVLERPQEIPCTQCFTVTRPKTHILKAAAALKRAGSPCLGLSIGKTYHSLQNPQKHRLVLILEKVPRA